MSSNFNCSYMARSSLTYIPFLAHLVFRPCELLPSLFVCPSTFHILIFSSETLVAILVGSWDPLRGATKGPFHKSLVAIGPVVSEEKIKM
jgi:hypothetical protein